MEFVVTEARLVEMLANACASVWRDIVQTADAPEALRLRVWASKLAVDVAYGTLMQINPILRRRNFAPLDDVYVSWGCLIRWLEEDYPRGVPFKG